MKNINSLKIIGGSKREKYYKEKLQKSLQKLQCWDYLIEKIFLRFIHKVIF